MDSPKISVIVPVYNVEQYLPRCIDSILAQTFTDFELLLIDDGSTDNSGKICDEYASKDSRIRVFHKENGGATQARAYGVNNVYSNSYICFVDSDDDIPSDSFQILSNFMLDKYDIIIGRANDKPYKKKEMTAEENRSFAILGKVIPCSPWARLIRRTLFSVDTFDIPKSIIRGEDMIMNIKLAFANNKPVRLVNAKIYNYHKNNGSIIQSFKPNLRYEETFAKYKLLAIPSKEYPKYKKEYVLSKIDAVIEIIDKTCSNKSINSTEFYKCLINEIYTNGIKLPFCTRIKLSVDNKWLICFVIAFERIRNKVKRTAFQMNLIFNKIKKQK
ncbi:glycosyltransferase [Bacteroides sp. An19]|uniref:glycosyltransferase family 2 protein n=1 Tax=Bacteroides sp. An19 TaxID=1965580 RepID=UPI000B378A21|nr:glycosyltransferase [Bacteroides sp. An19]OUP29921.1 hypothetical protein B5F25_15675 [Bacteroides sp. An19]